MELGELGEQPAKAATVSTPLVCILLASRLALSPPKRHNDVILKGKKKVAGPTPFLLPDRQNVPVLDWSLVRQTYVR